MSRRENEFKHRTSIFEGAFRAWSHLGSLDPDVLDRKTVKELLDLLNFPIANGNSRINKSGSSHPDFPYEPLPRAGTDHPFVRAILSPWIGPEADSDAVKLGLNTLRTWWQHRRKGESKTAQKFIHTEQMEIVVRKYTLHFFELAHCLVVNDNVQPPRTLHSKLKQLEKKRERDGKESGYYFQDERGLDDLSPLEKVHALLRGENLSATSSIVKVRGKCIPGKIDLPGMVKKVSRIAGQKTYYGGTGALDANDQEECGDPKKIPIVFYNNTKGDCTILLEIDGITCAHCVKIVETVLKGCRGDKSPIDGLLDAAADHDLSAVLIKIDKPTNAKRVAFEATRNLSLVGYTAKAKEVSTTKDLDKGAILKIFKGVAMDNPCDFFDWECLCSCPDSGVFRDNCNRHSQIGNRMYNAFASQEQRILEQIIGKGGDLLQVVQSCQGMIPTDVRRNSDFSEGALDIDQPMDLDHLSVDEDGLTPDMDPLPLHAASFQSRGSLRYSDRYSGMSEMFGGHIPGETSAIAIDWEALEELQYEVGSAVNQHFLPQRGNISKQSSQFHEQQLGDPYAI